MAEFVVDTNVWINADKVRDVGTMTLVELDCLEKCYNWLQEFIKGTDLLAVDSYASYEILKEYRRKIRFRSSADEILRQLERKPQDRLIQVFIEFDEDGYAILPEEFKIDDKSDRKFVAVSLKFDPPAPIISSTETDWTKDKPKLDAANIIVQELCPDYIAAKLK